MKRTPADGRKKLLVISFFGEVQGLNFTSAFYVVGNCQITGVRRAASQSVAEHFEFLQSRSLSHSKSPIWRITADEDRGKTV